MVKVAGSKEAFSCKKSLRGKEHPEKEKLLKVLLGPIFIILFH